MNAGKHTPSIKALFHGPSDGPGLDDHRYSSRELPSVFKLKNSDVGLKQRNIQKNQYNNAISSEVVEAKHSIFRGLKSHRMHLSV